MIIIIYNKFVRVNSRRRRVILSYKEKVNLTKQIKQTNRKLNEKKFVARAQKNNVIFAIDNDF